MTLNYEMKKILILVQSCNDDFFKREIECIKETYASNLPPNIDFAYYTGNNEKEELIDDCLKLTCSDDIYSTFRKTYYALRFLHLHNMHYDYIVKTNTSTYINVKLLNEIINSIEDDKKLYCTELYSLSDGCCPTPLALFARGNCIILSKYWQNIILHEGISFLYLNITDDKTIGNIHNSFKIKTRQQYIDNFVCFPHGWYKCIDNQNTLNNHKLCKYGASLDDYSNFLTVQIKNYVNRNLEFEHFKEIHNLFKNENVKQACSEAFEYSKNPSIFIGSILGYIDLETWKKIDKAQLYQVEINNKAIDDKLI